MVCRLEENCGQAIKQQDLGELEESFKSYKVCTSTRGSLMPHNHVPFSMHVELILNEFSVYVSNHKASKLCILHSCSNGQWSLLTGLLCHLIFYAQDVLG